MGKKVAPERDRRINHEMEDHGFKIKLYNGKLYWHNERTEQRIRLKSADRWLRRQERYEKDQQEGEKQRDAVLHLLREDGVVSE